MSNQTKFRFIVIHESTLSSWLKDVVMFGSVAGVAYVNNVLAGNSAWINAFVFVAAFTILFKRAYRKKLDNIVFEGTRAEFKAWLREIEEGK